MFAVFSAIPIIVAQAEQQTSPLKQGIASFFPFILLFVVLYFMWIRPEQQRARKHKDLVKGLKAGDRVITTGGLHGTVTSVTERTIKMKIADKVEAEFERAAVGRLEEAPAQDKGS